MAWRCGGMQTSAKVAAKSANALQVSLKRCSSHGLLCPWTKDHQLVVIIRNCRTGTEWVGTMLMNELPKEILIERNELASQCQISPGDQLEATAFHCKPLALYSCYGDMGLVVIDHNKTKMTPSKKGQLPISDNSHVTVGILNDVTGDSKITACVSRPTYSNARVVWISTRSCPPEKWMISLYKVENLRRASFPVCYFFVDGLVNNFVLPVKLTAGKEFSVCIRAVEMDPSDRLYLVTDRKFIDFSATLTESDLGALYDMALTFCNGRERCAPCNWLYRNKLPKYFNDIFQKHRGVMKVYDKDSSGDQASSINGRIKGLFFMANNAPNGQPPPESPFGPVRLQVPAFVLVNAAPNLYFVDFYCMRGKRHFVTLVMTKTDSSADRFCSTRLMSLDIYDNPFFFCRGPQMYANDTPNLLVELLYTENININHLCNNRGAWLLPNIPTVGKGQSTTGGVPKNPSCRVCNLPVPTMAMTL